MRGNIISFRFDDAELEALQAFQTSDDKSPNQTAARLLRGILAGTIEQSTVLSTGVDNLESLIDKRIEESLAEVRSQLEAQLEELRGKLKAR